MALAPLLQIVKVYDPELTGSGGHLSRGTSISQGPPHNPPPFVYPICEYFARRRRSALETGEMIDRLVGLIANLASSVPEDAQARATPSRPRNTFAGSEYHAAYQVQERPVVGAGDDAPPELGTEGAFGRRATASKVIRALVLLQRSVCGLPPLLERLDVMRPDQVDSAERVGKLGRHWVALGCAEPGTDRRTRRATGQGEAQARAKRYAGSCAGCGWPSFASLGLARLGEIPC